MIRIVFHALILLAVCSAGCSRRVGHADGEEMTHPMMGKASTLEQDGDLESAIRIYRVLLEEHPDMGRAHLGLALLLDRPGGDPVRAIYHYQRYLEIRPETEKREMLEGRIRAATSSLVRSVYATEASVPKRLSELENENRVLRVRCANLETRLKHSQLTLASVRDRQEKLAKTAERNLNEGGLSSLDIRPAVKTVRVQRNDTLRRIAMRVYGSQDRWQDIYEANRDILRKPEDVRVDQVLVIPE